MLTRPVTNRSASTLGRIAAVSGGAARAAAIARVRMRGADRRHRERERRAHGRTARQQRQRDEDTGDEMIGGRVPRERRARRGEEGMARAEPGRDGEREDADRRFGGRVAYEPAAGIDPARAQAAAEPAAE